MAIKTNEIPGLLPKKEPRKCKSMANHILPLAVQATYNCEFIPAYITVWATFANPWSSGSVNLKETLGRVFDAVYPRVHREVCKSTNRGEMIYLNVSYR